MRNENELVHEFCQKLEYAEIYKQIIAAPKNCGVYFFYNNQNYPLYIGKSINIRQRLLSHYYEIKQSPKEAKLFYQTKSIHWQETAGELGALLLEAKLIKDFLPLFNRQLRRLNKLFTLKINRNQNYATVEIIPFDLSSDIEASNFGLFKNKSKAQSTLISLMREYKLCEYILRGFPKSSRACFSHQLRKCAGACLQIISPEQHQVSLMQALQKLELMTWPYNSRIAIKESHPQSKLIHFHIIDRWRYLTTLFSLEQIGLDTLSSYDNCNFDRDYYLTLARFLKEREIIIL